jgi:hypothetical protein
MNQNPPKKNRFYKICTYFFVIGLNIIIVYNIDQLIRNNYKKDAPKTTIVPASATEETLTLAEEGAIAFCECPAIAQLVALKQEQALIEGTMDEDIKKTKDIVTSKILEAGRALKVCIAAVDAKVKALDAEAQTKFKADFSVAFVKECPELSKSLMNWNLKL